MTTSQIETTIGALAEAEPALERLAGPRLDAKTRYHIVKLARLVRAELQTHFYEPRQEAFKEFGVERASTDAERAQHGDTVLAVPPDQIAPFRARMKELCDVAVTVPWGPVTPAMVEGCAEITALDLLALGALFEMADPATPAPASP